MPPLLLETNRMSPFTPKTGYVWKYNRETNTFKPTPPPEKDHTTLIIGIAIVVFFLIIILGG